MGRLNIICWSGNSGGMSASEDELPSVSDSMIDSAYESFQAIFDGLPVSDESPLERYDHFDNATELLNYVQEELELGEEDIGRVLDEFENAKCPYCEEEGDTDATLDTSIGSEMRDSYRKESDEVTIGYFEADCENPEHDVFWRFEERWYE